MMITPQANPGINAPLSGTPGAGNQGGLAGIPPAQFAGMNQGQIATGAPAPGSAPTLPQMSAPAGGMSQQQAMIQALRQGGGFR